MFESYSLFPEITIEEQLQTVKRARKSRNPFRSLSAADAQAIALSDSLICDCLQSEFDNSFRHLFDFIPFEQIIPHLKHGLLAEALFQKELKQKGLRYDNMRRPDRDQLRQKVSLQAYVDLVGEGVFEASVLSPFGKDLPKPSTVKPQGRPEIALKTMFYIVLLGCRMRFSDHTLYHHLCRCPDLRRFVGITDIRRIPAPATIWYYRNAWAQFDSLKPLHKLTLQRCLENLPGIDECYGKAVALDGSFVEAPKRHVSAAQHQQIINGVDPVDIFEKPAERRQRDVDARHTVKNKQTFFGYKDHTKVCLVTKLVMDFWMTPANTHDALGVFELISEQDKGALIFGDSAYNGRKQRLFVECKGAEPLFMRKPSSIKKLSESVCERIQQRGESLQELNHWVSSKRVRIEHVFGHIQTAFGGSFVRSVSAVRALAYQWLTVACYNAERTSILLSKDGVT